MPLTIRTPATHHKLHTLNNSKHLMRLTSTLCFWRFSDSSVVSLETGTLGQPRLCTVTVGWTGEAGAIRFICPSTASCTVREERNKGDVKDKERGKQIDRLRTYPHTNDHQNLTEILSHTHIRKQDSPTKFPSVSM